MPRQRRLNIPGAIYHVITRGINRSIIFRQKKDREDFLRRLSEGLENTKSRCYAWALMDNHVHLLIRNGETSLGDLMRKILTGYALYFNHKYNRCGYLFQNRYKSILCQEECYLLELVKYIHLNPVRAGIVSQIDHLNSYPWTGHSVLMGKKNYEWQTADEILLHFHKTRKRARKKYGEFIKDSWEMGKREDLIGGGLRRNAGGWQEILKLKRNKEFWRGDERMLGDGDFVNEVLKAAEEKLKKAEEFKKKGWSLEKLVEKVCEITSLKRDLIQSKRRIKKKSSAIAMIAYWGFKELEIPGNEIARYLNVSGPAISKAVERGGDIIEKNEYKLIS